MQNGMRIAVAIALLAGCGRGELWASESAVPHGLTVQRSPRAIPRKFVITPNRATVAANQTQHFQVTDAQGNPVAVRWNVSGLGCSGVDCGTIDEHGVYRTPSSVTKARVVILEGVLISDPNYSVLTEIELAPDVATNRSPASAPVSSLQTPPMPTLPAGGRNQPQVTVSGQLPVVAPPPMTDKMTARRTIAAAQLVPSLLPVVPAAPTLQKQNSPHTALLPSPDAIPASPVMERKIAAREPVPPPLPRVTGPAPVVEKSQLAARDPLPALPQAVAAAPSLKSPTTARVTLGLPLSTPIGAPARIESKIADRGPVAPPPGVAAPPPVPVTEGQKTEGQKKIAPRDPQPPLQSAVAGAADQSQPHLRPASTPPQRNPIGSPPAAEKLTIALAGPLPRVTAPPPVVDAPKIASPDSHPSLAPATAATPAVALASAVVPTSAENTARLLSPAAAPPHQDRSRVLLPMLEEMSAAKVEAAVSDGGAAVVTYRDGQLAIDARNATLAEVLRLVAEKTGATIEVPPGTGLERIVEHSGPAPAQEVLAKLLNGSLYDFIIVSSPQGGHAPAQVLLSLHRPDAPASVHPEAPKVAAATPLWKPPDVAPAAASLYVPPIDPSTLPPKGSSPEALAEFMKEKARQLREQLQQQQPQ
jgi:hypothetical protein